MAATAITVQQIKITDNGLTASYAAANVDGNYFANNGQVFLHFKNSGTERTVTIDDPTSVNPGHASAWDPDVELVVAATTGDKMIGPFPVSRFGSVVNITYDTTPTGLTVAAYRL